MRFEASSTLRTFCLALLLLVGGGCSQYQPFDSSVHLRGQYAERVGQERARQIEVPFELGDELRGWLGENLRTPAREPHRVDSILDLIFRRLDLRYSLAPTRNARQTFQAREGNCLSFVNLFVGVAREQRLNAFYVEVSDAQSWSHREGLVVSQGHIVAGVMVIGEMRTFDFLPYRTTAYRQFRPISDLRAAAHYFNNLGAEALLDGDDRTARGLLLTALDIAPDFDKALNNLGVALARQGRLDEALALYDRGLELDPESLPLLTNKVRALQQLGDEEEVDALMERISGLRRSSPFFLVYQGDLALARGQPEQALDYLGRALREDSELAAVHVALVRAYLAIGDTRRARHHLERALRLDATNLEARYLATVVGQE